MRGLTTASAIWITAGLGMACGAGLFFTATLGSILTVAILKISRVQESLQMSVRGVPLYSFFVCWVCVSWSSVCSAHVTLLHMSCREFLAHNNRAVVLILLGDVQNQCKTSHDSIPRVGTCLTDR